MVTSQKAGVHRALPPSAQAEGVVGPSAHERGVARLMESFAAIPAGERVRLAKSTSNLFRPRERGATGLDVSGLAGVIKVDPDGRTADVQGMCTYENLVEATAPYGLMPLVVPQLRTITLGGAVTGLGIESTSFCNGLPHESVLEMDVLTGSGEHATATPDGPHADLFAAMPNSYGSLGYSTRLRIELQPLGRTVMTRNVRFESFADLVSAIEAITRTREFGGAAVDALDGVVFGHDESYLVVATFTDEAAPGSDYAGQDIYYRSLQRYDSDRLTGVDYLWRWDTDWFWCSRAFGVQQPLVRRVWPRRWRRSDVYHRLVGIENRYHPKARYDRLRGRPDTERVVQDVEIPLERTEEFLTWFLDNVPMRPVWICPLQLRRTPDGSGIPTRSWPLYPMRPGTKYVNVGFWGGVPVPPGRRNGDVNRMIEDEAGRLDGHKSLYSDVYYDRATFDRLYNGEHYRRVKDRYDPGTRLTPLFEKVTK